MEDSSDQEGFTPFDPMQGSTGSEEGHLSDQFEDFDVQAEPVRCQNSAMVSDQRFQAAASYSLIKPPRIGRRRILPPIGSRTGAWGRGGRNFSDRCGRRRL